MIEISLPTIVQKNGQRNPFHQETSEPASGFPLVRFETFLQAIRDSGYKGTSSAIAELVDNAIEAQAGTIAVDLFSNGKVSEVSAIRVTDDGHGMIPSILQTALQFGGSTRFNSRDGFGRFGMGLPCSSLSIAQRVDVYTWTAPRSVWWSYLDANEVSSGGLHAIPRPERSIPPCGPPSNPSGTVVVLSRRDRLDISKISHLEKKLHAQLGRIFRYHIQRGTRITINGQEVKPVDPLFLAVEVNQARAKPFGPPLLFPIRIPCLEKTSVVQVRFSELPIAAWHNLPNAEKRKLGISKGAAVSVIRAGREVDCGWCFMGSKRRENYDDWWRCEVHYEPVLDEVFGLTHTKQRVRPAELLEQVVTPEIEAIARTLNARVRSAFASLKRDSEPSPSERRAQAGDVLLEPPAILRRGGATHIQEPKLSKSKPLRGLHYHLRLQQLGTSVLFEPTLQADALHVVLNTRHAFYEHVYGKIMGRSSLKGSDAAKFIDLLILAYSRAEMSISNNPGRKLAARLRILWSEVLSSFLS